MQIKIKKKIERWNFYLFFCDECFLVALYVQKTENTGIAGKKTTKKLHVKKIEKKWKKIQIKKLNKSEKEMKNLKDKIFIDFLVECVFWLQSRCKRHGLQVKRPEKNYM